MMARLISFQKMNSIAMEPKSSLKRRKLKRNHQRKRRKRPKKLHRTQLLLAVSKPIKLTKRLPKRKKKLKKM